MINNDCPVQTQLTDELLKQKKIIKREKDDQNITDDSACLETHSLNRFQNDICATSVIIQVNKPENTPEKLSDETPYKLEHYSVSTPEGITWHDRKRTAYESSTTEVLPVNIKARKEPSIIESVILQKADCLITRDNQWISFLQDFFKQIPIQASSINRITSLQTKAGKVKEIVFLVEHFSNNRVMAI